jgi:hypothetical protein
VNDGGGDDGEGGKRGREGGTNVWLSWRDEERKRETKGRRGQKKGSREQKNGVRKEGRKKEGDRGGE